MGGRSVKYLFMPGPLGKPPLTYVLTTQVRNWNHISPHLADCASYFSPTNIPPTHGPISSHEFFHRLPPLRCHGTSARWQWQSKSLWPRSALRLVKMVTGSPKKIGVKIQKKKYLKPPPSHTQMDSCIVHGFLPPTWHFTSTTQLAAFKFGPRCPNLKGRK